MKETCKKILPLVLAVCVLCSQLSLTALAKETYPENAAVVTEDTAITGGVDALVLVDAPVRVDVTDAQLAVGLFISPDAGGAVVTVAGETSIKEIVVAAAAAVKVKKTAAVEAVTVDASAAAVEIDGTVETVTVNKTAEGASIVVSKSASVAVLEVAAPGVRAEVAGTVESVLVRETASGMELVIAGTADVAAVTDSSGGLTVSGDGAGRVTIADTSPAPEKAAIPEEQGPLPVPGIPEAPEDPGGSVMPGNPQEPEIPENPEVPAPDDRNDDKEKDPPGISDTISWGTIDSEKNGSVSVRDNSVSISGEIGKTTINQQNGYWVGFRVSEGYTVALKQNDLPQESSSALAPVLGDADGFVYFAIDGLVIAAIDEAAENVEREDEERTIWITGTVCQDAEVTIAVTSTAAGATEDVTVSVSVHVMATERRTIPAEEAFEEEEEAEEASIVDTLEKR